MVRQYPHKPSTSQQRVGGLMHDPAAVKSIDNVGVLCRNTSSTTERFPYNAAMPLTEKQRKYLRRLAHPLNPVVMLGNAGLTDSIVKEAERALHDHELIKVSARLGDRESRDAALGTLAQRTASELVQRVGNVGVLYKRSDRLAKIVIPDR